MPLIRHDLALSYLQVGLLAAVPLIAGSLLELPVGVLAGAGRRRRLFVLGGGLVFIAAVLGAGLARSFPVLLAALVIFFPASGAFVSLTQAAMMDADTGLRARHMAMWTLAGAVGSVAGPLLVAAVLAAGGSWRVAFVLVAAAGGASWLAVAATGTDEPPQPDGDEAGWPGLRAAVLISRAAGALRWLVLLQVADLLLDVFTAFLALYLVGVEHVTPSVAALGVAVRLGAGLAGCAVLTPVLARFDSLRVLRASAVATGLLFPAFLLVPGIGLKLLVLAAVSVATAPWYPVLMAELYASLPGRSGLAVSLTSAAGLAGGLGPLAVGLLAQHLGLGWALAWLCVVPVAMLAAPAGRRPGDGEPGSARLGCRD
jgi:MFS transporter, FSR family, fosmidomycin resistance protein